MTSSKDQLQAMIAEIDAVLRKASPRLPWVMSGDVERQRRVLERVRSYLVSLQPHDSQTDGDDSQSKMGQRPEPGGPRRSLLGADLSEPPATVPSPYRGSISPGSLNQQVLQAVVEDLRNSLMAPIQGDLEALQRQRSDLLGEIRQLENQRQQYSMAQQAAGQQQMMREFLQLLTERLQESMTQQVAQILRSLEAEAVSYTGQLQPSSDSNYPLLTPSDRLAQMRMLQAESDQLLMKLDSSIAVVFETLQRNINSYQESLSQGIDKMYGLGHQGEVMFSALINTLAEQLGREASSFVQSRPERSGKKVTESGLQLPKANGPEEKPEITPAEPELSWSASEEATIARKRPPDAGAPNSSSQSQQLTEALELLEKLNINQIAPRQESSGKTLSKGDVPSESEQTQAREQDAADDDDGLFDAMFGPESLATGSESLPPSDGETASESSSSNDETSINQTATAADLFAEAEEPAPEERAETARSLEDLLFASEEGSGTTKTAADGQTAAATEAIENLAELFPEEDDLEEPTETPPDEKQASSKWADSSDVYIPASPEEDLLPPDEREEDPDPTWFSLNPIARQQLHEDLENLEKEPQSATKTPESPEEEVRSTLAQTPDRTDAAVDDDEGDGVSSLDDRGLSDEEVIPGSEYVDDGLGENESDAEIESEGLSTDAVPELENDWEWEEPEEDSDPTWISLEPITQEQLNAALGRNKSQKSAAKTQEKSSGEAEDGGWDDGGLSETEARSAGFDESEDSALRESEGLSRDALPELENDWGFAEPEEDPDPTWISLEPIAQEQLNAALGRDKSQKSATESGPENESSQIQGSEEVQTGSESVPDADSDLGLDDWGLAEIDDTDGQSRRDRTSDPEQKTSGTDILLMGTDEEIGQEEEERVQDSSEYDSLDEFLEDNSSGDPGSEKASNESLPESGNDWGFEDWGVPEVESGSSRSPEPQEENEARLSVGSEDISLDEFLEDNSSGAPGSEKASNESLPESGNDWGLDDWGLPEVESGSSRSPEPQEENEAMQSSGSSDISLDEFLEDNSSGESGSEKAINEAVPESGNDWGLDDWGLPDVDSEGSDEGMQSVGSSDESLDEFLEDNSSGESGSEKAINEAVPESGNDWGLDDWGLPDVDSGTNPPQQNLLEDVSATEAPTAEGDRGIPSSEFEDLFADVPSTDEPSNQGKTKAEVKTGNMKLDDAFADFTAAPITSKESRSPQGVSLTPEPTAEADGPRRESEFEDLFADLPSTPDEPSGPGNPQAGVKTGNMKLDDAFANFIAEPTAEADGPRRESEFEDLFADLPSTPDEPSGPRNPQAEVKTGNMKLDDAFADFKADPITPKQARSPSPKQMKTQKKKKAD